MQFYWNAKATKDFGLIIKWTSSYWSKEDIHGSIENLDWRQNRVWFARETHFIVLASSAKFKEKKGMRPRTYPRHFQQSVLVNNCRRIISINQSQGWPMRLSSLELVWSRNMRDLSWLVWVCGWLSSGALPRPAATSLLPHIFLLNHYITLTPHMDISIK